MTRQKPAYLHSIGRLLGFSSTATSRLSARKLAKHDLTVQQWISLTALWRTGPLYESDLAEYCRMSASSLNRLLDRMEAKKLVRRTKDNEDKRRSIVDVGAKGKKLAHLIDFNLEINEILLEGFSAQEGAMLASLLQRVIENLEAAEED